MNSRRVFRLGVSVLSGLLLTAAAVPAEQVIPSERSWRTLEEMTAAERALLDLDPDAPRDPEIQYLPAEPYPFEPPYTAEEIGYRIMNFRHLAPWSHVYADVFGVITKTGYLTQGITAGLINQIAGDHGVEGHLRGQPGDTSAIFLFYYGYPPKNEGLQEMWVVRRTGPKQATKLDYFIYTPSLRRVRRQPPPRRDQQFPDNVPTFDDIVGRDAWEYGWRLIGADVLFETVRFPNNRTHITLARPDNSFYDQPTAEILMMGDTYPYYRADGGIDCFVVAAEPKPEWLADYNVSKIIYWVDQHYFFPLRTEQYDRKGKLKIIEVRTARHENPGLPEGEGYTNALNVWHDLELDLLSYGLHDAHRVHTWSAEEQVFFTPDFMRRRWLTYQRKSLGLVDRPEQFYLRPDPFPDRFPAERPVEIPPEIASRIEAQEAAGHLVFGASE